LRTSLLIGFFALALFVPFLASAAEQSLESRRAALNRLLADEWEYTLRTQPELATQLRDRKLDALMTAGPDTILSANVGCIAHLATAAPVSVQHWIEWVDSRLYF